MFENTSDSKQDWNGFKLRERFWTPYNQTKEHIGKKFEVLRELTAKENPDAEEVGTMFKIRLDDGNVIDAWPEEIYEQSRTVGSVKY